MRLCGSSMRSISGVYTWRYPQLAQNLYKTIWLVDQKSNTNYTVAQRTNHSQKFSALP